jgi:lipoate-protein ligase A
MRRWDIVLQHGTIVLDNDSRMLSGALKMDLAKIRNRDQHPETYVTSIAEVTGQRPDISKIEDALVRGFSRVFDVKFQQSGLTDFEKDMIDRLINEKYKNHDWNFRR